ncbi:MAG: hypothetical protein OXP74_17740 [Acidobacteriota bacterium]|nr:hypothetical protein [Acidobacteriota bacterium]
MLDWFFDLSTDKQALVLAVVPVAIATVSFVSNHVHQIFVRRMDRMTRLLSLAAWLSAKPSSLVSDELLDERNKVSAEASAIAYLGLDKNAGKLAQSLFERDEEVWADFAKPLWRSCHPFKRLFRKAPTFRFRYVTKSVPVGSFFAGNFRAIEVAWKKCIAGTANDTQRIRDNIMHVEEVPKSGDIETPALVFFSEGSREDDAEAFAVSVVGAGEDENDSYAHARSLIRSLFKHLERPRAVHYGGLEDMYLIKKFPHFGKAMVKAGWRASCARIVVRSEKKAEDANAA